MQAYMGGGIESTRCRTLHAPVLGFDKVIHVWVLFARVSKAHTSSKLVFGGPRFPFVSIAPATGIVQICVDTIKLRKFALRLEMFDLESLLAAHVALRTLAVSTSLLKIGS